jgi:radical SAM superfamily enzyme YgiQ (UPF0313 family)
MSSKNDILLVNLPLADISTTPFFIMPPGLLAIASYLREHSINVQVLDLNIYRSDWEKLLPIFHDRLSDVTPRMVGISVMVASQFKNAKLLCACVKEKLPGTITVVGGAHVSQFPNEIIDNCSDIDFVVIGEGEIQSLALNEFASGKLSLEKLPDGIAYRLNSTGKAVINSKENFIVDVNTLPFPAYDMVQFDLYRHDASKWHNPYHADLSLRVPIITSRGCPNLCNFCSVGGCMGLAYRCMDAQRVVDMIEMLYQTNGARYFAIFDANFAQDEARVIEICSEITRRNLSIFIDLPTGLPINATAPIMIDALASVGLIRTCISIESGDEYIRNTVMMKGVEDSALYSVIESVRKYPQIFLLSDFVIGMPEDTKDSLERSCKLIDELDTDDIALSIATPYPGTKLFEQCIRDDLFLPLLKNETLYNAGWYSHANLSQFVIKPYYLEINLLKMFRDRILSMREKKLTRYRTRMKNFVNSTGVLNA